MSSASAVCVAATKRRETAEREVLRLRAVTADPTGSRAAPSGAVDTLASIRSIAIRPSSSAELTSS
jgi:hypothetical protein